MRRILLMVLRLIYIVPVYFYRIWKYSKDETASFEEKYAYVKKVTKRANRAGRVTLEVHGLENLPREDGFILYPNHQGMFDVLVFFDSCPAPFTFVLKKEARNLILLKQVADALGALAIDRENLRQSMQVINTMAEQVKKGRNFLIFAEGTRSKLGNQLLEFKGGSFKAAVKAKCPIVPCALKDSFVPFDENTIRPVTVKVQYLPPMYYEEYKDMNTREIAAEVKRRIQCAIG